MEDIYNLIQQRNATETLPFLSIHSTNAYLQNVVDTLQIRCESLERQYLEQQQLVVEQAQLIQQHTAGGDKQASSKTENRLREKIAKLQEELNVKLQNEVQATADALKSSKEMSSLKEQCETHESTISGMQIDLDRCNEVIKHLTTELEESRSRTRLAETQIDGLKDAIRALQDENEEKTKLNDRLIHDAVTVKEQFMDQFNSMNDTVEKLQKEADMLRSLNKNNKSWFGLPRGSQSTGAAKHDDENKDNKSPSRQWGASGAVLPSQPQYTIQAHKNDATCVRYDGSNLNLVATASSDSTVRVWDTSNGQLQATFSGGSQPMLGVDISGGIVCGCGADKTCRVWRYDTKRMVSEIFVTLHHFFCLGYGTHEATNGAIDTSTCWTFTKGHLYKTLSWRKECADSLCRSIN
jgi:autophagy-related protein 16